MKTRFLLLSLVFLCLTPGPSFAKSSRGGELRGQHPQRIMAGIFQPWSGPLGELGRMLPPRGSYVVWINVPAQHPMDVRSAEYFRRWVLPTPLSELSISHSMVAWRCEGKEGRWITGATGLTGGTNKQEKRMFLGGFGLSVFFSTFTDAYLQSEREVGDYILTNRVNRGAVYTGFEVSATECGRMLSYLKEFIYHPSRPHAKFSFNRRPEKMEGGSCVTLVAAMLRRAGILADAILRFERTLKAPRALMGGNIPAPESVEPPALPWLGGRTHSVSYQALRHSSWEYKGGPAVSLKFMDPEKMLYAQKQMGHAYLEQLPPARRAHEAEILAVTPLGKRTVRSGDDSGGGLKIRLYPINDAFDPQMKAVGRSSLSWFRSRRKAGYRIRRELVLGNPALLLERR